MERGSCTSWWKYDLFLDKSRSSGADAGNPWNIQCANALAAYATVYALMMNNISLLPIQIAGSFVGEVKLKPGLGGALSVVMMAMMVIMIFVTNGISRQFQKGVKKV